MGLTVEFLYVHIVCLHLCLWDVDQEFVTSLSWNVSSFFLSMMVLQENVCYACGQREKQNVTITCFWLSSHSSSLPSLSYCHLLLLPSFGFLLYFPVLLFVFLDPDPIFYLPPSFPLSLPPPSFLTPSLSPTYPTLSPFLPYPPFSLPPPFSGHTFILPLYSSSLR